MQVAVMYIIMASDKGLLSLCVCVCVCVCVSPYVALGRRFRYSQHLPQ